MKTNFFKYYITAFYLCSSFITFAQPGTNDDNNNLEGDETPGFPIDDYVLFLAAIGLVYVFWKIKVFKLQGKTTKD